jgi:lipoyl(octanoyl) transferase
MTPKKLPVERFVREGGKVNPCSVVNLGLIGWAEANALQQRVVSARKAGLLEDTLLLCEHPHTITLGRNGKLQNLLASESVLRQKSVELHHTNRGGDITYHGPGQLVGYPILNLAAIKRDVGWYMRMLEEAMILTSGDFGITAERETGKTGIWVAQPNGAPAEKLAAIGVHLSRWVTSHGFAYNVATDLRYFQLIVPCGIVERSATSLEKLLGRTVAVHDVIAPISRHLVDILQLDMRSVSRVQFLEELAAAERTPPPAPQAVAEPATTHAVRETVRSQA